MQTRYWRRHCVESSEHLFSWAQTYRARYNTLGILVSLFHLLVPAYRDGQNTQLRLNTHKLSPILNTPSLRKTCIARAEPSQTATESAYEARPSLRRNLAFRARLRPPFYTQKHKRNGANKTGQTSLRCRAVEYTATHKSTTEEHRREVNPRYSHEHIEGDEETKGTT